MTTTLNDLLHGLNPQQHTAVTAGKGPVLVLAGPGSGKTGVLTRRVAYLIRAMNARPRSIMAVTFTNKAAGEMKRRVQQYLGEPPSIMAGTFHSICARLLRIEHEFTPYKKDYVIFDTDDQVAAVGQALGELGIDPRKFPPRRILHAISSAKNELKLPHQYVALDYFTEAVARAYPRYQSILLDSNALDFDDLLVQTVLALHEHEVLRDKYQRLYEWVLVDEFQDTNTVQYQLVELLGKPQNNIFAVGDEDQSIYAFRGADYRNVLRFRRDYPAAQVILLEQNYRSSQTVLDVARAVIDRNSNRTPKALFTERGAGDKITVQEAYDDEYEARYVVEQIERLQKKGRHYSDIAVMYRTNTQSRALEDQFIKQGVPYTLVGGVGFYKRREVKDILGYLRVVNNPNDRIAFARIINTPKRGIGDKSLQEFQNYAAKENLTNGELLQKLAAGEPHGLPARTAKLFTDFALKLSDWQAFNVPGGLGNLLDTIVSDIGFNLYLYEISSSPDEANERIDNVRELRGLLLRADEDEVSLGEWLVDQSLMTDADEVKDDTAEKVTLLTLHAAKGLEYPIVFIVGLEEGLLPHFRALEEGDDSIQEERRLLYVGVTRAKEKLYLTYAFRRTAWGGGSDVRMISRFLADVPEALMADPPDSLSSNIGQQSYQRQTTWDNNPAPISRLSQDLSRLKPTTPPKPPAEPSQFGESIRSKIIRFPGSEARELQYKADMRVKHPLFGEGRVENSEIDGREEMVTVLFDDRRYGRKTLMSTLANLTIL